MWSLYQRAQTLIENSEAWDMLTRFPQAGDHNSDNFIFVAIHPSAVNPLVLSELIDDEGFPLTGDALAWAVATEMVATDRSRAIHGTKSEFSQLHQHPAWKIWCSNYEDRSQFQSDWNYVVAMIPGLPVYTDEMTYVQAKDILLAIIRLEI